jgi:hypothetical protein
MEEIKPFLKNLLAESRSQDKIFKRNILKEYLQILVLDFIYSHKDYSQLIFYGGSCLAHCYGLPRLSEDLDFVDLKKQVDTVKLAEDLEAYFKKNTDIAPKAVCREFRVHLKFPLLKDLGLAEIGDSDLLFLKVEVFKGFDFCGNFKTEIIPLFKFNRSALVKTFDLPTLMSTKIRAVLLRRWERTDKQGKITAKVKGRDYFDLMWYLEKNIKPNISCIAEVKSEKELKEKLLIAIDKADASSIRLDLEPLIADRNFVEKLSKNLKDILRRGISKISLGE